MTYRNAYDVLPPRLVREIQKHYTGRLWVPAESTFYRDRNRLIQRLRNNGESVKDIANLINLSEERVRQIVAGGKTQK